MERFAELFDFLFLSVFSEAFALWFLVGLVLFLVGLLVLGLFILSRTLGVRTTGTVIGAVKHTRVKQKQRDGKQVQKTKTSLYPVYEYRAQDGSIRQMRSSEGGSMTLKYSTGQTVNLIVREDKGYDDVYDADELGALYVGLGIAAVGVVLMTWVGSFVSAVGMSGMSLTLAITGLLVSGAIKKFTATSKSGAAPASDKKRAPYSKAFDAADLHPIEHFQT